MSLHEDIDHPAEPRWVLVNGELRNVSEFASLLPRDRPDAECPVCREQVTMKLGMILQHHYAHASSGRCPANHPETAEHLNAKFHIYKQLLKGRQLIITKFCDGHCGKNIEVVWVENWDKVAVEYSVDSIRPDIALIRNGSIIAAIEVYMWHQVDDKKKEFLKQQNISWLETSADPILDPEVEQWHIDLPLPYIEIHPDEQWKCHECSNPPKPEVSTPVQTPPPYPPSWNDLGSFENKPIINIEKYTSFPFSSSETDSSGVSSLNERVGTCIFCKTKTKDWWYIDGKTGNCKCRPCYWKGLH